MSAQPKGIAPSLFERAFASAWGRFLALSVLWVAIGTLFALQVMVFDEMPGYVTVRMALLDWGPWILLSPLVLWFSQRIQINNRTWRWALPVHCVACIFLTAVLELTSFFVFSNVFSPRDEMMGPPPGPEISELKDGPMSQPPGPGSGSMREDRMEGQGPRKFHHRPQMVHARFHVPIYWMLVASIHALAFHRRSLERERRMLLAEASLTEARLAALQSQIRPHFLFNTLNTIAGKVQEDPAGAEQMIVSLSELLRRVLAASEKSEVSLREELAFVDLYLSIQQTRFVDRLRLEREIDPELLDTKVPVLLLQPIVENAILHGIAKNPSPGLVRLRVSRHTENEVLVEVSDSGPGSSLRVTSSIKPDHEGIGLRNTKARLEARYGQDYTLTLTDSALGGKTCSIRIPRAQV